MKQPKCIDCGKNGVRIACNSCSNVFSVCDEHREQYFMIINSECVCIDCQNAGMGGIGQYIASRKGRG